jgi:hypothetical protein
MNPPKMNSGKLGNISKKMGTSKIFDNGKAMSNEMGKNHLLTRRPRRSVCAMMIPQTATALATTTSNQLPDPATKINVRGWLITT